MAIIPKSGGGKPEEEKTVTAGTSAKVVTPSDGKTIKKVTVNPTPSQSKSVTPNESAQTVIPDSGKLLSSVSVSAIQTEEKTVTAGTSATTVTPTSGKYIKKVTVNPTPSQSKTVTPSTSQQTVSPDSGKLLSQVIIEAMESGISVEDLGYTKYAIDTITPTTANSGSSRWRGQVPHSLGEIPQAFIIFITSKPRDYYALKAFASFYLSGVGDSKNVWAVEQGVSYSSSYNASSQPFTSSYVDISRFVSNGLGLDVGSTYAILTMA